MNTVDFEAMPLKKLLWKLATPMMIAFLVQALYNTVDTIFVGQYLGDVGVAALLVVFPLQLMLSSISQLFAAGGSALISIALGKKEADEVKKLVSVEFLLGGVTTLIVTLIAFIYLVPILELFGAAGDVLMYAQAYMDIVIYGIPFVAFATLVSFTLRTKGNVKASQNIMLVGAFINIVLDPIFVFTLDLGLAGAAIATIMAQIVSALLAYYYMFIKYKDVHMAKPTMKDISHYGSKMTLLGLSSFIGTMMFSVVLTVSNVVLKYYGSESDLALFGSSIKLTQLMILPIFGLVAGMQPIVGYNFGAKRYDRVKAVYRLTLRYVIYIVLIGSIIIELFPRQILNIFSKDEVVSIVPIRIIFLGFVGAGIVNTSLSYLQSIGLKWSALFLSFLRQVILYIPLTLLMAPIWEIYAVWVMIPISDMVAALITIGIVYFAEKKVFPHKLK